MIDRTARLRAWGPRSCSRRASSSPGKRLAVPIGLFAAAFVASTVHAECAQDLSRNGATGGRAATIGLLVVAAESDARGRRSSCRAPYCN